MSLVAMRILLVIVYIGSSSQQELALAVHSIPLEVWNPLIEEIRETSTNFPEPTDPGRHRDVPHFDYNIQYDEISLGTPSQVFNMMFDTITSDLWVPAQALDDRHLYNHRESSTYHANGSYFNPPPYVAGTLGEATESSRLGPGYLSAKYDGVFGLGFDGASQALVETALHHMMRQGSLDSKMFSLYCGRNGNAGELILGGYGLNRFKGELIYIDTASPVAWVVGLDEIRAGNLNISDGTTVTLSSMGSLIFGPSDKISQIAETFGGKEETPGTGIYLPDRLYFESARRNICVGRTFVLNFKGGLQYMLRNGETCILAFIGGMPSWMIGMSVLSKYYFVFGMNSKTPRIGLTLAT